MCTCAEGKIFNERGVVIGESWIRKHNCQYIIDRNSLIPMAESYANNQVRASERGGYGWARVFNRKMDQLVESLRLKKEREDVQKEKAEKQKEETA